MADISLLGVKGGEREKTCCTFHPLPLKTMCGETPRGPNGGKSDMHNNNKMACWNTGGLAAVVEWETDVNTALFNRNNYSTV